MPPGKAKPKESRSRNGTPLSTDNIDQTLNTQSVSPTSNDQASYDDLLDSYCKGTTPPASVTLKKIADALRICSDVSRQREANCDHGMREFSNQRKELAEIVRDQELAEREAEERGKDTVMKLEEDEDSRPLAVGAHSLARQDGLDTKRSAAPAYESTSQAAGETAGSPPKSASSTEAVQPPPAPPVPQAQTFGEDPSTFDDPTIYHIREVGDDATEEEKKEIFGVAEYPQSDLHDETPGTPPDRDFSNVKLDSRVTAIQFNNYLEPYTRPLTQEDLASLEERGDRVAPFMMPRRGPRPYQAIWDEEDGNLAIDNPEPPPVSTNQAMGNMEQMNDESAERGDISVGPLSSRLLQLLRPERRGGTQDTNGNTEAPNAGSAEVEMDGMPDTGSNDQRSRTLPPASSFQESSQPGWKNQPPKMDSATLEERLKQEMRFIGLFGEDEEPDYEGHHDDEVAARLRYLQDELQKITVVNGARKARVLELAEERMAQQEWSQIKDDLDNQLNQAFLKRHRNVGKGKKVLKRPGAPGSHSLSGSAGVGKSSVGEPIRDLMERRNKWIDDLGPVTNYGRAPIKRETIFDDESMARLMAKETESMNEAQ